MGIYMCMKSGCRVSGEDFAHSKYYKGVSFYSKSPCGSLARINKS